MTLRGIHFFLIPGTLLGLGIFPSCTAAPTTYDQRQDGKYNVHANLENFLILVATSGSSDLLNDLTIQALELQDLAMRSKSKAGAQQPESVVYETEDRSREPYHVEIVRIDKEGETKSPEKPNELPKKLEKLDEKLTPDDSKNTEKQAQAVALTESDKEEKKARSLWRDVSRKLGEGLEKEENPGTAVEVKQNGEMEILKESKDAPSKAGRPGASLKKQLSKKEQENAYLVLRERNDVSFQEEKPQELKLLGGGIENCGPGRYRDNSGICQFDKSFNKN